MPKTKSSLILKIGLLVLVAVGAEAVLAATLYPTWFHTMEQDGSSGVNHLKSQLPDLPHLRPTAARRHQNRSVKDRRIDKGLHADAGVLDHREAGA